MANIKGTNVASPVVPFTEQDIYPTHEAKYGKGGFRTCATLEEMNSIPTPRREEGMFVYVEDDPSGIHNYQYINGKFVRNTVGRGIPVYNNDLIKSYGINPARDTYISIPDESDLDGGIEENIIKTSINGTYIDVLFQSIRQLQAEVARLKNTMRFGLESYTENHTAMSTVLDDLEQVEEEEPIWAIDENSLSDITGFTFELGDSGAKELKGGVVEVAIDPITSNSYLRIKDTSTWESGKDMRAVGDSKVYVYSTLLSLGQSVKLGEVDENGVEKKDGETAEVSLNKINMSYYSEKNLYNTIVIISRKNDEDQGDNFIWVHINDPYSDRTCAEGYYNPETGTLHEDMIELDTRFTILSIDFSNVTLYKFKIYSKMQDFSHNIIASKPDEADYKYKVAHITIRSVSSQTVLNNIKDQLLENELIWEETNKRLWIKSGYKLVPIGMSGGSSGGGGSDEPGGNEDNMTTEELIATLKNLGIVAESTGTTGDYQLSLNDVADITFIHQGSGKKFKFEVTSEGNLQGRELSTNLLENRVTLRASEINEEDIRGFIGQLHGAEAGLTSSENKAKDYRLNADRLKIGAFYAPYQSDSIHGCSHSFVELENTSDKDIPLEGCYLHFTRPKNNTDNSRQEEFHLALTGTIKAGSTYLIRGAKHAEVEDPNVYIKVKTYDQEWWNNGSLVSFEINDETITFLNKTTGYGFALTYGNESLTYNTALIAKTSAKQVVGNITIDNTKTYPFTYNKSFIDAVYYVKACQDNSDNGYWAKNAVIPIVGNSMYKNTFELDPAKQAFQGLTQKDSSRTRWGNVDNDYQVVDLTNEYIEFPNSPYRYAISNYTPKASFEGKNVSTDKTKLDKERPNMVTCAFGIDIYRTRTFNWISLGNFDEYVWIRQAGTSTWTKKCQSYIPYHEATVKSITSKTSDGKTTYDVSFEVTTTGWSNGTSLNDFSVLTTSSHSKIAGGLKYTYNDNYTPEATTFRRVYVTNVSSIGSLQVNQTVFLHKPDDALDGKKYFGSDINNNIYARMIGRFPGDGSFYTAHKVIVDVVDSQPQGTLQKYDYVVGREGKDGNPDPEHCSEVMNFTLYPNTYKTRIYQITDQQGFTWIEYQAWAAAAEALNAKINADQSNSTIIPILINTGDMTQNGTRVNEWYDYYTAGSCLFNHLEQMNVVGNNDLCGPNPEELGTGDDSGKSNAYYFHVFYCYEVDPEVFVPLVQPTEGGVPKYIPSTYFFDSNSDRFLAVNSEITETTCKSWFGLTSSEGLTANLYTGYDINGHNNKYVAQGWTTVYTMLYKCFVDAGTKPTIVYCHEMPFTVITSDALKNEQKVKSRSISPTNTLVGSHLNQISKNEVGDERTNTPKGIYWFTRLIENFNVKLVLGGHKHTYACTYPVRENYYYRNASGTIVHSHSTKMTMGETLDGDTISIYDDNGNDTTKRPLTKKENKVESSGAVSFYPTTCDKNLEGGIVYFMCQATGYKQTSNKELPSPDQEFSFIVSQTTTAGKADAEQKYPMFGVIDVSAGTYTVKLARITNIMNSGVFKQTNHGTGTPALQWMIPNSSDKYGDWVNTEDSIYKI